MLQSKAWFFILFLVSFSLLFARILQCSSVELIWDENSEPDLAGYKLYYGISSRTYTEIIDVGMTASYTVEELQEGVVYYFAVTAYNDLGEESDFSDECMFLPLSVLTPGAGESIEIGTTYRIEWEADQAVRSVRILLSTNSGRDWMPLNIKTVNDGSWSWKVPEMASDSCLIKLESSGNPSIRDVSSIFSIVSRSIGTENNTEQRMPGDLILDQNYPNPFNPMTTIAFGVPEDGEGNSTQHVIITIYDSRGRRVKKLLEGGLVPGYHQAFWDGRDEKGAILPSGIYFYELKVGKRVIPPRKMVLAR